MFIGFFFSPIALCRLSKSKEWVVVPCLHKKGGRGKEMRNMRRAGSNGGEKRRGENKDRETDWGRKKQKKRLPKERGCVTPTRTGSLNFPPGRRVTEPKANEWAVWPPDLFKSSALQFVRQRILCGSRRPSASRLRARRNYNLHFSPRQRARTCSRIHQLAICALQLPQLGILIRSDTHMFGECLELQICVSALILCVCICSRSTWPGPWQTLDQREVHQH